MILHCYICIFFIVNFLGDSLFVSFAFFKIPGIVPEWRPSIICSHTSMIHCQLVSHWLIRVLISQICFRTLFRNFLLETSRFRATPDGSRFEGNGDNGEILLFEMSPCLHETRPESGSGQKSVCCAWRSDTSGKGMSSAGVYWQRNSGICRRRKDPGKKEEELSN